MVIPACFTMAHVVTDDKAQKEERNNSVNCALRSSESDGATGIEKADVSLAPAADGTVLDCRIDDWRLGGCTGSWAAAVLAGFCLGRTFLFGTTRD